MTIAPLHQGEPHSVNINVDSHGHSVHKHNQSEVPERLLQVKQLELVDCGGNLPSSQHFSSLAVLYRSVYYPGK